jgi:chromate transporter
MPSEVPFGEALRFWIKLGFISFGGPAGQIAILHRECVERRQWIDEERFLHSLNFCMLLPGPEAQQLATYIGWLLHGVRGGLAAGIWFVLPSAFLLAGLSYVYAVYGQLPAIAAVLDGVKLAVVALVAEALLRVGRRALRQRLHWFIAAAAFVLLAVVRIPFPAVIAAAGLFGWWSTRQGLLTIPATNAASTALPAPPWRTLLICFALWLLPFALLTLTRGTQSLHANQYLFFSRTAFLTFGGAYAVLSYITQAVTAAPASWLTPAQAMDGLALAETTPGPLIMVLQFIGFVAAWNRPEGLSPLAAGLIGAALTTYATFLPCFLFIFAGAPYMEVLRGWRSLSGALSAITAAVVGVILNLALVFASATLWHQHQLHWPGLLIAAAAFTALSRGVGLLPVILSCGFLGWLLSQLT